MRQSKTLLLAAVALALAACVPGVAEYTKTEAPTAPRLYGSESAISLSFAPGSTRLAAGQYEHLTQLVRDGEVGPADRVAIAAAGGDVLARDRFAVISRELLRYGIVASQRPLAGLPLNRAVLVVRHYAVILPPCPDWSKSPSIDFTNEPSSNFGCANAINLGRMAASPADLAGGRTLAGASGKPTASAVERYLNGQVTPLATAEVGPIAMPSGGSGAPPAAGP